MIVNHKRLKKIIAELIEFIEDDPEAAELIERARTVTANGQPAVVNTAELYLKKWTQDRFDRFGSDWTIWDETESAADSTVWQVINNLAIVVDAWHRLDIHDPATTTGIQAAYLIAIRMGWIDPESKPVS